MKERSLNLFRKLHQKLGVFLALFLLLLATTGIALNHSEFFKLDEQHVPGWIASFYYPDQKVLGKDTELGLFYSFDNSLYVDGTRLSGCASLLDLEVMEAQVVVLCRDELIIFTQQLELIERLDATLGLPADMTEINTVNDKLAVKVAGVWQIFDLYHLSLEPMQSSTIVSHAEEINSVVPANLLFGEAVTWQQFILDLHSGAVVGLTGKLFNDLVALFVMVMALSGLLMWRNPRRG